MADNTTFTPGSGAGLATDLIASQHYQRIKISLGTDGSATDWVLGATTRANSAPVTLPSDLHEAGVFQTIAELASASITSSFVSVGTLTAGTRIAKFVNTTSVWLVFSCNGGTNAHIRVPPFSKEAIDLGSSFLKTNAAVWAKYDTVSPGSGNGVAAIEGVSV